MSRTYRHEAEPWDSRKAINGSRTVRRAKGHARLRPYGQRWYGATCRCCTPALGKWWKSAERFQARLRISEAVDDL